MWLFDIKMCVYDELSYDKVLHPSLPSLPLCLALTPSPALYLCIHACLPLIFLPWETRKPSSHLLPPPQQMHNSIPLCMRALFSLKSVLWQIPQTLTQYDLAQINSSKKTTLELSLCKKCTLTTFITDSTTPTHTEGCCCLPQDYLVLTWSGVLIGVQQEAEWPQVGIRKSGPEWVHSLGIHVFVGLYSHLGAQIITRRRTKTC